MIHGQRRSIHAREDARGPVAGFLLLLVPAQGLRPRPAALGSSDIDRVVTLVVDNFHDPAALDGFGAAVRQELDGGDPLNPKSTEPGSMLRSRESRELDASHTARFTRDTIAYYRTRRHIPLRYRHDMKRLFPPDGRASYAGVGMVARMETACCSSATSMTFACGQGGYPVGDEVLSVDGAPYREIESFRDRIGQKVEIRLRRNPGAQPFTASVAVERLRPLPTFEKAIENSVSVNESDGRRIGYLRLWTLSSPDGLDIAARELATRAVSRTPMASVVDLARTLGRLSARRCGLFVGDTPNFRLISRNGKDMLANVRWRRPSSPS